MSIIFQDDFEHKATAKDLVLPAGGAVIAGVGWSIRYYGPEALTGIQGNDTILLDIIGSWQHIDIPKSNISGGANNLVRAHGGNLEDWLFESYYISFVSNTPVTGELDLYLDDVIIED